jgi:hypothetical protein
VCKPLVGGLVGGRLFQTRWKGEKIGSLIERDFKGERWMKCQDPENQRRRRRRNKKKRRTELFPLF